MFFVGEMQAEKCRRQEKHYRTGEWKIFFLPLRLLHLISFHPELPPAFPHLPSLSPFFVFFIIILAHSPACALPLRNLISESLFIISLLPPARLSYSSPPVAVTLAGKVYNLSRCRVMSPRREGGRAGREEGRHSWYARLRPFPGPVYTLFPFHFVVEMPSSRPRLGVSFGGMNSS